MEPIERTVFSVKDFRTLYATLEYIVKLLIATVILLIISSPVLAGNNKPKIVSFQSGDLRLAGELFLPIGDGPFPVVLFNHGSAPKMKNSLASAAIGPQFTKNGWALFMPYRRGQGLSQDQGPYIMDEVNSARWKGWGRANKKLVELLTTDHLSDQLAAFDWLKEQPFIDSERIATLGNSFGGIQVMLGMQEVTYCAGVNASGAAQSWADSKELQKVMKSAAINPNGAVLFFQAENDYDLAPSESLSALMKKSGKVAELIVYPPFGKSKREGHSLPWRGVDIWFNDTLDFLNRHCRFPDR